MTTMPLVETRLSKVRALVLEHLRHQDGTHETIVSGTGQCDSSVSQVLLDLHTERLIHIGCFTKKSARHRYVRNWRHGPGIDATAAGLETAMQQNADALLALLTTSAKTRAMISADLGWSKNTAWATIAYLRELDLIHMCAKIPETGSKRLVHQFRAGEASAVASAPEPRAKKQRAIHRPPPDPLMAALFGR